MYAPDKLLFNQLVDFLAGKPDFYINFKEFINWFFLEKIFILLKNNGYKETTGLRRLIVGFSLLGMRLSRYCLNNSVKKFDV
jgi:hypothetical protein